MKACLYFLFVAIALSLVITPARSDQAAGASTVTNSHLQLGETPYPTSLYPAGTNSYFIEDKGDTNSDASVVFRDQGNARAEIGIVENDDLHFKTVTGKYGAEVFTDRLLIRASGQVNSFGTLLRQYATSGRPTIVVGDSDLTKGSGLELQYDQDNQQAGISSVDHDNIYRNLIISSNGVQFFQGEDSVSQLASISNKGLVTSPAVVSGGTKFTIRGCAADATVGGAAAGTFKSGMEGTCKVVITMNGAAGMAAPHGWACSGSDLSTAAHLIHQTASTTTTATLAGETETGDIISFYCMGY